MYSSNFPRYRSSTQEEKDDYIEKIPYTREHFQYKIDIMNKNYTFTDEEVDKKWKNLGCHCSRECQHNILCPECGGDSYCRNCYHDGIEKHNCMCINWILNGYNAYPSEKDIDILNYN